jgi:DNA-binding LacI/PurR family transcriptional regulator
MTASSESSASSGERSSPLTIAQIAELAGVSIPTVSKVVNGKTEVSPGTRALVEQIIDQHGYRRQRKPSGHTPTIELVFHELERSYGYAMEIISGVEEAVRENHMSLLLSQLDGRHLPDDDWLEGVLRRHPVAVIAVFSGLSPAQRERLRARNIPLVLVDPTGEPTHDVPSVGASNWSGGLTATRHLVELGHRRIAAITGPLHVLSARARLDGYRAAMDAARIPIDPALICEGDFHIEDGITHTRTLLALPDPPTAVFAANDAQAMGVYRAVAQAGLRVPDDMSVVGFDDLPAAQWVTPPLTTVHQPLREMAMAAVSMAFALSRGAPVPQPRLIFATELNIRGSTAAPTAAS